MKINLIIWIFFIICFPALAKADLGRKELRVTLQSSVISLDPGGVQDSQSLFVSRQASVALMERSDIKVKSTIR